DAACFGVRGLDYVAAVDPRVSIAPAAGSAVGDDCDGHVVHSSEGSEWGGWSDLGVVFWGVGWCQDVLGGLVDDLVFRALDCRDWFPYTRRLCATLFYGALLFDK